MVGMHGSLTGRARPVPCPTRRRSAPDRDHAIGLACLHRRERLRGHLDWRMHAGAREKACIERKSDAELLHLRLLLRRREHQCPLARRSTRALAAPVIPLRETLIYPREPKQLGASCLLLAADLAPYNWIEELLSVAFDPHRLRLFDGIEVGSADRDVDPREPHPAFNLIEG